MYYFFILLAVTAYALPQRDNSQYTPGRPVDNAATGIMPIRASINEISVDSSKQPQIEEYPVPQPELLPASTQEKKPGQPQIETRPLPRPGQPQVEPRPLPGQPQVEPEPSPLSGEPQVEPEPSPLPGQPQIEPRPQPRPLPAPISESGRSRRSAPESEGEPEPEPEVEAEPEPVPTERKTKPLTRPSEKNPKKETRPFVRPSQSSNNDDDSMGQTLTHVHEETSGLPKSRRAAPKLLSPATNQKKFVLAIPLPQLGLFLVNGDNKVLTPSRNDFKPTLLIPNNNTLCAFHSQNSGTVSLSPYLNNVKIICGSDQSGNVISVSTAEVYQNSNMQDSSLPQGVNMQYVTPVGPINNDNSEVYNKGNNLNVYSQQNPNTAYLPPHHIIPEQPLENVQNNRVITDSNFQGQTQTQDTYQLTTPQYFTSNETQINKNTEETERDGVPGTETRLEVNEDGYTNEEQQLASLQPLSALSILHQQTEPDDISNERDNQNLFIEASRLPLKFLDIDQAFESPDNTENNEEPEELSTVTVANSENYTNDDFSQRSFSSLNNLSPDINNSDQLLEDRHEGNEENLNVTGTNIPHKSMVLRPVYIPSFEDSNKTPDEDEVTTVVNDQTMPDINTYYDFSQYRGYPNVEFAPQSVSYPYNKDQRNDKNTSDLNKANKIENQIDEDKLTMSSVNNTETNIRSDISIENETYNNTSSSGKLPCAKLRDMTTILPDVAIENSNIIDAEISEQALNQIYLQQLINMNDMLEATNMESLSPLEQSLYQLYAFKLINDYALQQRNMHLENEAVEKRDLHNVTDTAMPPTKTPLKINRARLPETYDGRIDRIPLAANEVSEGAANMRGEKNHNNSQIFHASSIYNIGDGDQHPTNVKSIAAESLAFNTYLAMFLLCAVPVRLL